MRRSVRISACDIRTRVKLRQHMRVNTHGELVLSIPPSRTWTCRDLDTKAHTGSVYRGAQQQDDSNLRHICHQRVQPTASKKRARAAGRAPPCAGQKSEWGHVRRGVRVSAYEIRTRAKLRQHMRVDTHDQVLLSIWPSGPMNLLGLRYKCAYWQCLQGRSAASRSVSATFLPPAYSAGGCEESRAGGWGRAAMRGSKVRGGARASRRAHFSVRDSNESETSSAHAHGYT